MKKHTKKNKILTSEYKFAKNMIKLYKERYKNFNNINNKKISNEIDFYCEIIAKYKHYQQFFPYLISNNNKNH